MGGTLILVNGLPGTGKSTLAKRLSHDLAYPMIGKDMLKEWLFDNMSVPMKDSAKLLGKSAAQMLYVVIDNFMTAEKALIIESAFQAGFDRPAIGAVVGRTKSRCIEIYCTTELEENRRRYTERVINGSRHPIHSDTVDGFMVNDEIIKKYEPLQVAKTIQVDTTHFGEEEYKQLLTTLRKELA